MFHSRLNAGSHITSVGCATLILAIPANIARIELYSSSSPERDTNYPASSLLITYGAPDIATESTSWQSWTPRSLRRLPHPFGIELQGTYFRSCQRRSRRGGMRWQLANTQRRRQSMTMPCMDHRQRGQRTDNSKTFRSIFASHEANIL